MKTIKPLGNRVLIDPISPEEKTKSGIILVDTNGPKARPNMGTVIEVGPGKLLNNGEYQTIPLEKGDEVLFSQYSVSAIKVMEKDYVIADLEDISATLE